jgi:hypothetical protein
VSDIERLQQCTTRIIELANEMKDEDFDPPLISAALMRASAIYATYTAAGNEGLLTESGIDKVVSAYRKGLENIQVSKKADADLRAAQQNTQ